MKTFVYLLCSLWLSLAVHAAELKIEPVAPVVEVGKEISLTVSGAMGQVKWSTQTGRIVDTGNQVTYKAPDQAGFDVVTVSDAARNAAMVNVTITKTIENVEWEVFTNRSTINTLLLSEDGKTLWVGTYAGLEKRDADTGDIQEIFDNRSGLPNNYINALLIDNQGGLWIGTNGGLAHYNNNPTDGRWKVFNTGNSGLPSNYVTALLSDNQGGLWIGTYDGGLAHYNNNPTDEQWKVFNTNIGSSKLPSNHVTGLLNDNQDGLWIGTGGGLAHRAADGQWQASNTKNSELPSDDISALSSDNQDGLWIGTLHNGLINCKFDEQWQLFNLKAFTKKNDEENDKLPHDDINTLFSDNQGNLWIGTTSGFVRYKDKVKVFDSASGLPHHHVTAILPPSEVLGVAWVGTKGGLVRYGADGQSVFKSGTLTNNNVSSLLSDKGGLWISFGWGYDWEFGGGVIYHTADEQWKVFSMDNTSHGLPDDRVSALSSDNKDGLWVSTYSGLTHYTNDGKWQVLNTKDSGLSDYPAVGSLLSDNKGGLWIGTFGNGSEGLAHYNNNPTDEQWKVFNTNTGNSKLPSNHVTALLNDNQDGLWIGTYDGGLAHYNNNPADEQWKVFNIGNLLPSNHVTALSSDNQGGLWIGTYDGLVHYTTDGQWQVFNTKNSKLLDDWITALSSDKQGSLWIGTRSGLAHLTIQSKQQGKRAAIVIASSGSDAKNNLWDATEFATLFAYKMLNNRKFANDEIYYLSSSLDADFNGDSTDDRIIDAPRPQRPLVLDDIRQAFDWAKQHGKLDQPLYVFFMGHGDTERLSLNVAKTDYISATDLKAMLDDYQTATGSQVVLVIEACYSGSLMPILAAPNRAIITSAKFDEVALPVGKQTFLSSLIDKLDHSSDFKGAYEVARRDQKESIGKLDKIALATGSATESPKSTQSPQLDDNGDGNYDPTQDGQWLKQVRINIGVQTADSSLAIDNLTPSTAINAGQAIPLKAKVVSAKNNVKSVWAVIRPPRINQVFNTNGTPILPYPSEKLEQLTQEKDIWQTTWSKNLYNGNYEITFYAENKQRNIAISKQDTVLTVSGGIEPPAKAQVQIQLDKTRYQRGEQFKATLTEDLGWGYDLYAAIVMPDGNYFTLGDTLTSKNTNKLRAVKEAKPWYAQRSKQGQSVTLLDLTLPTDLPTGQYCIYGILSPEQNDVFEAMNKNLWVYGQQCFELF